MKIFVFGEPIEIVEINNEKARLYKGLPFVKFIIKDDPDVYGFVFKSNISQIKEIQEKHIKFLANYHFLEEHIQDLKKINKDLIKENEILKGKVHRYRFLGR